MNHLRPELRAMAVATLYFEAEGYGVEDVSRKRGHNGYDLLAIRGAESLKIEVKGATRPWGIPDPYVTEFDADKRLIADFLCMVYFIGSEPPKICLIPREAITAEHITVRTGYRISGRLKKQSVLERYVKSFTVDDADG